jgi:hypothetical protein
MIEALRIAADIPPPLPEASRGNIDAPEKATEAPGLIELLQVSFTKAYAAHFTIFGGHYVSVHIKRLFRRPVNYWIDLRYVESMPTRVFTLDRPALWMMAGLGVLSIIFFLVAWLSSQPLFWLSIAVPMVCSAVLASLVLAQRSKYRMVFCSRYARIPWFELLLTKPKRRAVDEFIKALTGAIHGVSNRRGDSHQERLGAELREQRRLREDGILSEVAYNSAKARLLGQHTEPQEPGHLQSVE